MSTVEIINGDQHTTQPAAKSLAIRAHALCGGGG
jgi:hypothetical protein